MISMRRNITALLATTLLVSLTTFSVKAIEINNEMFSGTVNSTVTSGFSIRASERIVFKLTDGISDPLCIKSLTLVINF